MTASSDDKVQFSFGEAGKIILYIPKDNAVSLVINNGSGDISLPHEAMPDDLSCHISSGSDDVTVQLKNAEFSTDTDGCKDGSIGKGENSLSIMSNSGTVIVK